MLVAKDVYLKTHRINVAREFYNPDAILHYKQDFVNDHQKLEFEAPTELYFVLRNISSAMYQGRFSVIVDRQLDFPLETENFIKQNLLENGFEVTDIDEYRTNISWEKGLNAVI